MEKKRTEVFGLSLTEDGMDNLACFLADNHAALTNGEIVEPPVDFNKPNQETQNRIVSKWQTKEGR